MTGLPPPTRRPSARRRWSDALTALRGQLSVGVAQLHRLGITIVSTVTFAGFFGMLVLASSVGLAQVMSLMLVVAIAASRPAAFWLLTASIAVLAFATTGSHGLAMALGGLTYLAIVVAPRGKAWIPALAAVLAVLVPTLDAKAVNPHYAMWGAALGLALGWFSRRATQESVHLRERTERSEQHAHWLEQRTALARELHDVVGHHVTAMVVKAEAGQVSEPRAALTEIADLGRGALVELDSLVIHLRDPDAASVVSAPPRLADIDPALTEPLTSHGIAVSVRQEPDLPLDEVAELAAYRIVQEGLTNVLRHAEASRAWVVLQRTPQHVRISVLDDGRGPPSAPGAGLTGIGERVDALGGVWDVGPRPEGGTQLDAFIPLAARERA